MTKLSIVDKTMIEDGAEFKMRRTYFKHIKGVLYKSTVNEAVWNRALTHRDTLMQSPYYKDLLQRTETLSQQETSSDQGDCIANKVHLLCVELQLMYSYLPVTKEFLVGYDDTTFKLKTFDDIGKLRHMVTLVEELSYEE